MWLWTFCMTSVRCMSKKTGPLRMKSEVLLKSSAVCGSCIIELIWLWTLSEMTLHEITYSYLLGSQGILPLLSVPVLDSSLLGDCVFSSGWRLYTNIQRSCRADNIAHTSFQSNSRRFSNENGENTKVASPEALGVQQRVQRKVFCDSLGVDSG